MARDVELIHRAIMEDAAGIANSLIQETELAALLPESKDTYPTLGRFNPETRKRRYSVSGQFFRVDPGRSKRGGVALSLDESVKYLPPETIDTIHWIGHRAIVQSLKLNGDKLGYLIAADAFDGVNYFDRFVDAHQQLRFL